MQVYLIITAHNANYVNSQLGMLDRGCPLLIYVSGE